MRVLIWHVHGSWTTAFVQGAHTYLVPVVEGRGPEGRGRARTFPWPANVLEVAPEELADTEVDVVVLQRPLDLELAEAWLGGRRPGRDLPAIWLEHNTPQGRIAELRHPAADRDDLVVVHVTHTNALFWDTGRTRTRVIEHGVVDPGHRYTGELARAAVVVNEPVRRGRVTGTDLLERLSGAAPLDVFGMQVEPLARGGGDGPVRAYEDLPQYELHQELARRRAYLHPYRWTSLGLSLVEAMMLGLPVVALATTEVPSAVPAGAGTVSNDLGELEAALRRLLADPGHAHEQGLAARKAATERFALSRFLSEWDALLEEVT
jgi:hypothetical protein